MKLALRNALFALVTLTTSAACATARTTTEYDPVAVQAATYWTGLFWVTVVIVIGVSIIAWAIAYSISESAKYRK